jgi:hypothetical protein
MHLNRQRFAKMVEMVQMFEKRTTEQTIETMNVLLRHPNWVAAAEKLKCEFNDRVEQKKKK